MNKDLKIIKKKYGESMAHLCREIFPTLLETEGLLLSLLQSKFHENHSLYDDIKETYQLADFKNYIYSLVDVENKNYIFNFEFYDIEQLPTSGDYIYISNELLNPNSKEYSDFYSFGDVNSSYGRKITSDNDRDIIVLEINNKKIYLKRFYG